MLVIKKKLFTIYKIFWFFFVLNLYYLNGSDGQSLFIFFLLNDKILIKILHLSDHSFHCDTLYKLIYLEFLFINDRSVIKIIVANTINDLLNIIVIALELIKVRFSKSFSK